MVEIAKTEHLEANFRGQLIQPGEPGYDSTRQVWNGMVDRRPSLIVRCSGPADVMDAVRFAQENDLLVSVRGGGHSFAGKAVCDRGLMIDLSLMRGVRVDPGTRTVWAQGGATWADVDHETQAVGLATTGGFISHTGIAGLTLGGGIGYLARKHGLAVDNLVSADVVTAEGELIRASENENPDLFWGLRGGGGNFGIVTAFQYQLHDLGPQVLGGFVIHPWEAASEVLRFYREFTAQAPDEVSCYVLIVNVPPQAPFPEKYWGRAALFFALCYVGPVEEGEEALRPLLQFGTPILNGVQPLPYKVLQQSFDEGQKPGNRWYIKANFWDGISDDAIETLLEHSVPLSGPMAMVGFEPMGGAINRVDQNATAFPHRKATYNFFVISGWINPEEDEKNVQWTRNLFETMRTYGGGVYVNYLDRDEEDRTGAAFGDNYRRLVEVKTRWDPTNFFRMNQNIRPER